MVLHWAIRLRSYDHEDAAKALLAQHDLLELLVDEADESMILSVRIAATASRDGGVDVGFYLLCQGSRSSAGLATTLHEIATVGLLVGYNLGQGVKHPPPHFTAERHELLPSLEGNETLPIKPDWSPIFDLIRMHGRPVTIDLRCRYSATAALRPSTVPPMFGQDAGTPVLEALRSTNTGIGRIMFDVVVTASRRTEKGWTAMLGRKLFGTGCTAVPLTDIGQAKGTILSPSEALRVWHAPYGQIQGRGLGRFSPTKAMTSRRIPKRGTSLGLARTVGPRFDREVEVIMGPDDRVKHIYIVGKTGSGKTNLLKRLARQDIEQGKGCLVISPHSDLIDHLIDSVGDRVDDIVLLDFGDPTFAPRLNPLAIDVETPADYARAAEQLTELMAGLNYHEFTGPVFRDAVRTALQTAALPTVRGELDPCIAVAVEIVRDPRLRVWAANEAKAARRDLELELGLVSDLKASDVSEYVRWVTAKFSSFAINGPLRSITSTSGPNPFSFRDIYRNQKILLVHLPDTYLTGEAAEFIGRFIFERIYLEARQTPPAARKDFYVHADEFQRFVNRDLEILVTEARKFRLGLAFAHQNLRQLQAFSKYEGSTSTRLAEAIFSNAGTLVAMRMSGNDVATLATELEVTEQTVRRIAQHEALVRATVGGDDEGAFTLSVPLEAAKSSPGHRTAIRRKMIDQGFWVKRKTAERAVDEHLDRLRGLADPTWKRATKPTASDRTKRPGRPGPPTPPSPSFLDDWIAKRRERVAGDDVVNKDTIPTASKGTAS